MLVLAGVRVDVAGMPEPMNQLREMVCRHARAGAVDLPIPRLNIRIGTEKTGRLPGLYEAMLCFILQGSKRVTVGDQTHEYHGASFLLASIDLPTTGQIVEASPELPYIAVALALDPATIAALLLDLPPGANSDLSAGFAISPLTDDLLDPLLRLVRLLDTPAEIGVLAPMIEREILYRILQGPQGGMLRQIGRSDSRLSQIRRSVDWIRNHYAEPFHVGRLAELAGMSPSSFHRHFRAVTAMSPLQYQKQIRLQEARRRLLARPDGAARVAFAVGYESASQFSREYSRLFGLPPSQDAARLQAPRELEDA